MPLLQKHYAPKGCLLGNILYSKVINTTRHFYHCTAEKKNKKTTPTPLKSIKQLPFIDNYKHCKVCPFENEQDTSMKIFKGRYRCFGQN